MLRRPTYITSTDTLFLDRALFRVAVAGEPHQPEAGDRLGDGCRGGEDPVRLHRLAGDAGDARHVAAAAGGIHLVGSAEPGAEQHEGADDVQAAGKQIHVHHRSSARAGWSRLSAARSEEHKSELQSPMSIS